MKKISTSIIIILLKLSFRIIQMTQYQNNSLNNISLDSVDNHTNSETAKKREQMSESILKFIAQTNFYQSLRNNYLFFKQFTKSDLKKIFVTGQIFRIKAAYSRLVIDFNQSTICLIIFGSVTLQDKKYNKGDYFITLDSKLQLFFSMKTTMVMIHKQDLQNKFYDLQNHYFKKKQIEKIFPVDLLLLNKDELHQLVKHSSSLEGQIINKTINLSGNGLGIYILYQGNYSLKSIEDIQITEISYDYFGEEILWRQKYQFNIQAVTNPYRFIFIEKSEILKVLTPTNISILKQIYNKKVIARNNIAKNIQENLDYTKRFVKKLQVSHLFSPTRQYKQINGKVCCKPINKQWIIEKSKEGKLKVVHHNLKINSEISAPNNIELEQPQWLSQRKGSHRRNNFQATIYKDQRAHSNKLFRKKMFTQPQEMKDHKVSKNVQLNKERPKTHKTERNQIDILSKTISVLLKYYESSEKLRQEQKNRKYSTSRIFVASSKQRRFITNMKLHREQYFRDFLELKNEEKRAFKTWR